MLQQKVRDENLRQSKIETKGSFYGSGCGLDNIFEEDNKTMATKTEPPL